MYTHHQCTMTRCQTGSSRAFLTMKYEWSPGGGERVLLWKRLSHKGRAEAIWYLSDINSPPGLTSSMMFDTSNCSVTIMGTKGFALMQLMHCVYGDSTVLYCSQWSIFWAAVSFTAPSLISRLVNKHFVVSYTYFVACLAYALDVRSNECSC